MDRNIIPYCSSSNDGAKNNSDAVARVQVDKGDFVRRQTVLRQGNVISLQYIDSSSRQVGGSGGRSGCPASVHSLNLMKYGED